MALSLENEACFFKIKVYPLKGSQNKKKQQPGNLIEAKLGQAEAQDDYNRMTSGFRDRLGDIERMIGTQVLYCTV